MFSVNPWETIWGQALALGLLLIYGVVSWRLFQARQRRFEASLKAEICAIDPAFFERN